MATNKERIKLLEADLGSLQDGLQRMEIGMSGKLHHLEETLKKLTETIMASKGALSHSTHDQIDSSRPNHENNEGGRKNLSSRMPKLEFPHYSENDPTKWFNQITQFFKYQDTTDD